MPDNNGGTGLDLLIKATDEVAREIGKMDLNDPLRPQRVKELYPLTHSADHPKPNETNWFTIKWMRSHARLAR